MDKQEFTRFYLGIKMVFSSQSGMIWMLLSFLFYVEFIQDEGQVIYY